MANEYLKLENELKLTIKIIPKSPLIIKEGTDKSAVESKAKGQWFTDMGENEIYIPGSTLKGLFRDRFYMMYQAQNKNVEDEFGEDLEEILNNNEISQSEVYSKSSEISQLFGSKVLKSRFFAQDTDRQEFQVQSIKGDERRSLPTRHITPIDRFTGGAVVPLEYEYTKNTFTFDLLVKNITVQELQNIYYIIRDSINGEIRIGNSKSRGFGQIEFEISKFEMKLYGSETGDFDFIKRYCKESELTSLKIGGKYLDQTYILSDINVDINNPGEFVKALFEIKGGS